MWKAKITVDGIMQEIIVPEGNNNMIFQMATSMFGRGNIQIIDIQKVEG